MKIGGIEYNRHHNDIQPVRSEKFNLRCVAVDAILVSPADLERYKDSHALVIKPALQEGRFVCEAA